MISWTYIQEVAGYCIVIGRNEVYICYMHRMWSSFASKNLIGSKAKAKTPSHPHVRNHNNKEFGVSCNNKYIEIQYFIIQLIQENEIKLELIPNYILSRRYIY